MAGTSLLALIDDIATLLDDVAVLTRNATKQTAGLLGDDLALNAEQVTGVRPDRELAVVWAVAKGSALNKVILVPAALALSAVHMMIITGLLMLGGAFLCFEGFEKIAHKFLHPPSPEDRKKKLQAVSDPRINLAELEKKKIRGAVRTDFILSAEIIVIALGTMADAPFWTRAIAVTTIATVVTIGIYVLVAGIVTMDDVGLRLTEAEDSPSKQKLGHGLLWFAPRFLKTLSVLGTIAMFLVGGGILVHGLPPVHHFVHGAEAVASELPNVGIVLGTVVQMALTGAFGVVAGGLLVGLVTVGQKLVPKKAEGAS